MHCICQAVRTVNDMAHASHQPYEQLQLGNNDGWFLS